MTLKPLADRVVIKRLEAEETIIIIVIERRMLWLL